MPTDACNFYLLFLLQVLTW